VLLSTVPWLSWQTCYNCGGVSRQVSRCSETPRWPSSSASAPSYVVEPPAHFGAIETSTILYAASSSRPGIGRCHRSLRVVLLSVERTRRTTPPGVGHRLRPRFPLWCQYCPYRGGSCREPRSAQALPWTRPTYMQEQQSYGGKVLKKERAVSEGSLGLALVVGLQEAD